LRAVQGPDEAWGTFAGETAWLPAEPAEPLAEGATDSPAGGLYP
jgi:hypothetical protein